MTRDDFPKLETMAAEIYTRRIATGLRHSKTDAAIVDECFDAAKAFHARAKEVRDHLPEKAVRTQATKPEKTLNPVPAEKQ